MKKRLLTALTVFAMLFTAVACVEQEPTKEYSAYKTEYMLEQPNGSYVCDQTLTESGNGEVGTDISAEIKTIKNYSFDENNNANVLSGKLVKDETLELFVYYTLNQANYVTEYYFEQSDGTFAVSESEKTTLSAKIGSNVSAEKKNFDGFAFDENNEKNVLSGTVDAENELTLKVYYVIGTASYTTEYYFEQTDGTFAADDDEKTTLNAKIGATVTAQQKNFDGYEFDENNESNVLSGTVNAENGLTLKVYYVLGTANYTTEYYFEQIDGSFVADDDEKTTLSAKIGTTVTAKQKAFDGYLFDDNNENNVLSGAVNAGNGLVLKAYYVYDDSEYVAPADMAVDFTSPIGFRRAVDSVYWAGASSTSYALDETTLYGNNPTMKLSLGTTKQGSDGIKFKAGLLDGAFANEKVESVTVKFAYKFSAETTFVLGHVMLLTADGKVQNSAALTRDGEWHEVSFTITSANDFGGLLFGANNTGDYANRLIEAVGNISSVKYEINYQSEDQGNSYVDMSSEENAFKTVTKDSWNSALSFVTEDDKNCIKVEVNNNYGGGGIMLDSSKVKKLLADGAASVTVKVKFKIADGAKNINYCSLIVGGSPKMKQAHKVTAYGEWQEASITFTALEDSTFYCWVGIVEDCFASNRSVSATVFFTDFVYETVQA